MTVKSVKLNGEVFMNIKLVMICNEAVVGVFKSIIPTFRCID